MVREGIVLGHRVSERGIEVDQAKIDVIEQLPPPTNVKGVRSFLGHAGVDVRWSHTKPRSPVRQARTALDLNQGVPVNLNCKLTRKQQTVKFKSVSAGFPNHCQIQECIGWISESLLRGVSARPCRYRRRQKIGYDKRVIKVIYEGIGNKLPMPISN